MESKDFTVVDVRTRAEYMGGHVSGSVNIPLQELVERTDDVKVLKQPIIFCCASGGRSGQATAYFKAQGLDCENGGSWMEVNYQLTK